MFSQHVKFHGYPLSFPMATCQQKESFGLLFFLESKRNCLHQHYNIIMRICLAKGLQMLDLTLSLLLLLKQSIGKKTFFAHNVMLRYMLRDVTFTLYVTWCYISILSYSWISVSMIGNIWSSGRNIQVHWSKRCVFKIFQYIWDIFYCVYTYTHHQGSVFNGVFYKRKVYLPRVFFFFSTFFFVSLLLSLPSLSVLPKRMHHAAWS